jgi:1-phosphatidylinositol-4-phosphate 5-kinase
MLLKMLPAYYNHVRAFENTLVTKFFGLHCVKLAGANQKKVRDDCSSIVLIHP